jgi:hypothetical protein
LKRADSETMERIFFDWSEPLLPQAARRLIEDYRTASEIDLSRLVVATNVGAAGRRLLELLVEMAEEQRLALSPPTITTVGRLPELLYRPQRPFAEFLAQRMAWAKVLQQARPDVVEAIFPRHPYPDDANRWLDMGEVLRLRHIELAADCLDFGQVAEQAAELPGFNESRRWKAMSAVQQAYHRLLDDLDLWDRQTARLVALEKKEYATERPVVLIGAVDLNRAMRRILDAVDPQVRIFTHCSPRFENRFDRHGCLIVEEWEQASVPLDDSCIVRADGPADQADEVAGRLLAWSSKYSAEEIAIGLPDESLAFPIARRLAEAGVPTRSIAGKTAKDSGPVRMLADVAAYLESGSFRDFCALVRHPDVYDALSRELHGTCYLSDLDAYATEHFGAREESEEKRWLGEKSHARRLEALESALEKLVGPLAGERPLAEWGKPLQKLLIGVYGDRLLDRDSPTDRAMSRACELLARAIEHTAATPRALFEKCPAWRTISWVIEEVEEETIPPADDPAAVPLLGWLELPLDDAPALVVTTFNEGFAPSSQMADAWLPDKLRRRLGLVDNARRLARDAYATSVLVHSRRDLAVIVGKRNAQGDPLMPSRLLFAVEDGKLAARAKLLFGEPPRPAAGDGESRRPAVKRCFPVPQPRPLEKPIESLSVSAFRRYLACPYRFYLHHLLQPKPIDDAARELDARSFGNLTHDVLKMFGECDDCNATDEARIAEMLQDFLEQLALKLFGRRRSPAIQIQLAQLRERLRAFAARQAERAKDGWRIMAVEKDLDKDPSALLMVDEAPIRLRGRIDRIDVHPEKGHAIFDYKTGEGGVDPERAHRKNKQEWIDLQLPLYRHLGIGMGFDDRKLNVGYVLLPKRLKAVGFAEPTWGESDYAAAIKTAHAVVRGIRGNVFGPPLDPEYPESDDFAAICQVRRFDRPIPDDEEEWSNGD